MPDYVQGISSRHSPGRLCGPQDGLSSLGSADSGPDMSYDGFEDDSWLATDGLCLFEVQQSPRLQLLDYPKISQVTSSAGPTDSTGQSIYSAESGAPTPSEFKSGVELHSAQLTSRLEDQTTSSQAYLIGPPTVGNPLISKNRANVVGWEPRLQAGVQQLSFEQVTNTRGLSLGVSDESLHDSSAPTSDCSTSDGERSFMAGTPSFVWDMLAAEEDLIEARIDAVADIIAVYLFNKRHIIRKRTSPSPSTGRQSSSDVVSISDAPGTTRLTTLSFVYDTFKRQRDGDDREEDARHNKQLKATKVASNGHERRILACPFAKYDRRRYSELNTQELNYRGCSSACLRDIARVKQHLY